MKYIRTFKRQLNFYVMYNVYRCHTIVMQSVCWPVGQVIHLLPLFWQDKHFLYDI